MGPGFTPWNGFDFDSDFEEIFIGLQPRLKLFHVVNLGPMVVPIFLKSRVQKSHATVPLKSSNNLHLTSTHKAIFSIAKI
jgi:hypothetical protein